MLGMKNQRGDTIIEVILAITVFSMLAVGAIAIMNQGINSAQRSLEITQVRQQIDAQAEALRFIHQTYINGLSDGTQNDGITTEWEKLRTKAAGVSDFGANGSTNCPFPITNPEANAFVLNARTASIDDHAPISMSTPNPDETPPPYAQLVYGDSRLYAYGIWMEAKRDNGSTAGNVGYIDFHIRACWESPGNSPAITLGTIVRLYDPEA